MNRYNSDDELKHYGVLGMKWGQRKGRSYTSRRTVKSEKYADTIEAVGGKSMARPYRKIAQINRTIDKRMDNYTRRQGLGKATVKTLLLGPIGSMTYNDRRSTGHGRLSALGSASFWNLVAITNPIAAVASIHNTGGVDAKEYRKKLDRKQTEVYMTRDQMEKVIKRHTKKREKRSS